MDSVRIWSLILSERWANAAFQKFLQNINISKFLTEKTRSY